MKKTLALCCLILLSVGLYAQDSTRVYSWEEALKASPDSVFRLDASKQKWESLPAAIFSFRNLRYLDISRNKLKELPPEMHVFTQLRVIEASRNQFATFPVTLCPLTHLHKIGLSRNEIETLPACIGYFSELIMLDMWDNPIVSLPDELVRLENVRTIDLRGILFSPTFQDTWRTKMPWVKWYFDAPCNCLEK